jgi:hypothetical protein
MFSAGGPRKIPSRIGFPRSAVLRLSITAQHFLDFVGIVYGVSAETVTILLGKGQFRPAYRMPNRKSVDGLRISRLTNRIFEFISRPHGRAWTWSSESLPKGIYVYVKSE